MTTRELILQELDQMPEPMMAEILQTIRNLKAQPSQEVRPEIWQAYLDSVTEREEVYRRLADS
jgi:hypothetical protein